MSASAERQFGGAFETEDINPPGWNLTNYASTTGDWNRDGRSDIAYPSAGGLAIQLANPDGSLGPPVVYPSGAPLSRATSPASLEASGASGTATLDVNGDGALDIAACVAGGGIRIFHGHGDGSFEAGETLGAGIGIYAIATGDLDGSGKLSVVAIGGRGATSFALSFLEHDGQLATDGVVTPLLHNGPIAIADFDRDGRADLAVAWETSFQESGNVELLRGNGDGGFDPPTELPLTFPAIPVSLEASDLDGDRAPDLVVASEWAPWEIVWNDGYGGLVPEPSRNGYTDGISIAIADLTGDGHKTILLGESGLEGTYIEALHVLGRGSLALPIRYYIQTWQYPTSANSITLGDVADFDGSGHPGVVAVRGGHHDNGTFTSNLLLIHGLSGGRFGAMGVLPTPTSVPILGLVAIPTHPFRALLSSSGNQLQFGIVAGDQVTWQPFGELSGTASAAISDIEHGVTLIADAVAGQIALRPIGNGALGAPVASIPAWTILCSGDADGDGRTDLLLQASNRSVAVALDDRLGGYRLGPWRAVPAVEYGAMAGAISSGPQPRVLVFRLALTNSGWGGPTISDMMMETLRVSSDGTLDSLDDRSLPGLHSDNGDLRYPAAAVTRDFDGDRINDLLIAERGIEYGDLQLLRGTVADTLENATRLPFYGNVDDLQVADWDNDGDLDIAVGAYIEPYQGELWLMTNNGDGTFLADGINGSPFVSLGSLAFGDIDGDGSLDVVCNAGGPGPNPVDGSPLFAGIAILYGRSHPGVTATQVALASSSVEPGLVHLIWQAAGTGALSADLLRRDDGGAWHARASLMLDGSGRFAFDDREVNAGGRYAYKLIVHSRTGDSETTEVAVIVPALAFALTGAYPNPASRELTIRLALADARPARLELFDLSGRRVRDESLAHPTLGSHELHWGLNGEIAPGIYWLTLTQASHRATERVAIVR